MSPEQFRQVADQFPDPALLLSKTGVVLAANRGVSRVGVAWQDMAGRDLVELTVTPAESVRSYLRLCARSSQPVLGRIALRSDAGQSVDCQCHGAVVHHDPEGENTRILLRLVVTESAQSQFVALNQKIAELTEEIHRRREAEDRLRAQSDWLAVTLSSIGDAVITTDEAGRVTFLNPVAEALTGWPAGDARGRPLEEVFHIVNEHSREVVESPVHRVLREGVVVGLANHTILIARDGREVPIDDSGAPIRGESGIIAGVVLVFRDVSERKAAQQVEREQAQVLTGILAATVDHIFVMGTDGRYKYVSAGGARVLGLDPGELSGKHWRDLGLSAGVMEQFDIQREKVVHSGRPTREELVFRTPEGEDLHFEYMIAPITGESGGTEAVVVVSRDVTERRQAERELKLQARVLESMAEGVSLFDENGIILHTNPAEDKMFGCDRGELIGQHVTAQAVSPPEVNQRQFQEVIEHIKARGHWSGEWRNRRKDGGTFTTFARITSLQAGDRRYFVCVQEDITERKQARVALEESELRFRQLAEHITDVFWMSDPFKPEMLYISPAYEALWGRSRESLYSQPRSFIAAVHPDDRERVIASLESQARGEPTAEEYRVMRPDGSVRWVWDRAFPVRGPDGQVIRVAGIAEDITERKRGEQVLRFLADASASLSTLVDFRSTLQTVARLAVPGFADWAAVDMVMPEGSLQRLAVAHSDPAKIKLAEDLHRRYPPDPSQPHGAYQVMRTGKSEMMGEIPDSLLVSSARDEDHLHILRELGLKSFICTPLLGRGRVLGVFTFVSAESGRRYDASDLAFAEELARRSAIAIENAQLYQALRDADQRKDEFLALLAHELRNPLAPISNALQILGIRTADPATLNRAREMMARQVQHLVRLVDDLLDVSRIMRGKVELRKERIDLGSVVARAVETAQPVIDAHGHELLVELPPDPVELVADQIRLAQVVGNLLTNAAKYSEPGGRIWLAAEREAAQVTVRVRDQGIGIDPKMLPKVFDIFTQVHPTASRSQGGLGIGLTLVKSLVEMHGGAVEAHSAGLGQGSEFVIHLPLPPVKAEAREGLLTPEHGTDAPILKRRVLVVDDHNDAANSLAMLLRLQGHEVTVVHDGASALEAVRGHRYEVMFLDLGMPGMDGYEVARQLRQSPATRPGMLVALTGWGQEEDRRRTREAGFDHHLVKPVEPQALDRLLAEN